MRRRRRRRRRRAGRSAGAQPGAADQGGGDADRGGEGGGVEREGDGSGSIRSPPTQPQREFDPLLAADDPILAAQQQRRGRIALAMKVEWIISFVSISHSLYRHFFVSLISFLIRPL